MRYDINKPQVSSETIAGESIIIDFVSGVYYSTEGLGAEIWEALLAGADDRRIIEAVSGQFAHEDSCPQDLADFITRLCDEQLLKPRSGKEGDESASSIVCTGTYHKPVLNRYSDMQDLLLLDPIHETDEQGWPMQQDKE